MTKIVTSPTSEQLVRAVTLAEEMHKESIYRVMGFNKLKVMRLALMANDPKNDFILVLAVDDNNPLDIIGFTLGSIGPHYFSDDIIARDYALFVRADARGMMAARRMVKEYERIAKQKGAKLSILGAVTGVNPERKLGFFQAIGYEHIGNVCSKTL